MRPPGYASRYKARFSAVINGFLNKQNLFPERFIYWHTIMGRLCKQSLGKALENRIPSHFHLGQS